MINPVNLRLAGQYISNLAASDNTTPHTGMQEQMVNGLTEEPGEKTDTNSNVCLHESSFEEASKVNSEHLGVARSVMIPVKLIDQFFSNDLSERSGFRDGELGSFLLPIGLGVEEFQKILELMEGKRVYDHSLLTSLARCIRHYRSPQLAELLDCEDIFTDFDSGSQLSITAMVDPEVIVSEEICRELPLTCLSLSHFECHQALKLITLQIENFPNELEELILSQCGVNDDRIVELLQLLEGALLLKRLSLPDNHLGERGVVLLKKALDEGKLPSVTSLDLFGNEIPKNIIKMLPADLRPKPDKGRWPD